MSEIQRRIATITSAYITRQNRRGQLPREPTATEIRRLQTWLFLFFLNRDLQARFERYLRTRARRNVFRRERLREDLTHHDAHLDVYEDPALQAEAKSKIPPHVFDTTPKPEHRHFDFQLGPEDITVLNLIRWYKREFMRWVDPIVCPECSSPTNSKGALMGDDLNDEDRRYGARIVELRGCTSDPDHPVHRFPRYNSPRKLLETRKGRCGEYANLFHLFLRSLSLPGRTVFNQEDHVWNEYYSRSAARWIHLDACEEAFDTPLIYSLGWGRGMSYVIGFGKEGARDLGRRYVGDLEEGGWIRRVKWDEDDLREELTHLTSTRRARLDAPDRSILTTRDEEEDRQLSDYHGHLERAKSKTLKGRQSGSKEWREMRDELGLSEVGKKEGGMGDRHVGTPPTCSLTSPDSLVLHGSATRTDDSHLTLTTDTTSQTGSAFFPTDIPCVNPFIMELDFKITKKDGQGDGADGMAFVCLSRARQVDGRDAGLLGGGGSGLGYDGLGGKDDWAVEVDTYQTVDRCNDPPAPHLSLHSPARSHHQYALAVTPPHTLPELNDSERRTLRVSFDPMEGRVEASLIMAGEEVWLWGHSEERFKCGSNGGVASESASASANASEGEGERKGEVFWLGLTAATGGIAQAHEVERFDIWDLGVLKEKDA